MLDLLKSNCYQDNIEQCLIDLGLVKGPAADAKLAGSDMATMNKKFFFPYYSSEYILY